MFKTECLDPSSLVMLIQIRFVLRGWIRIRFVLTGWIRIRDPDPVCPERLDPDPVCPERLDPDPVNIRPDPQPCPLVCLSARIYIRFISAYIILHL